MARVGIVGTTSWGTTLAIILARKGVDVSLWARTEGEAHRLGDHRENDRFVPGTPFPESLTVTASPRQAFQGTEFVIVAVPSSTMRRNLRAVGEHLSRSAVVVSATKGLEVDSGKRMSQLIQEELPASLHSGICAMSGPNLATEIVNERPSSTVIASANTDASGMAQQIINSPLFRVYTNEDIIGVELGGALKNIIAIGSGICDGLRYGDNAKAAFMTRGLAEIARLGEAAGASPLTFAGLAGMGDLVATCSSTLSRNHSVGEQLARGKSLNEIRDTMKNVAEGINTTAAAVELAATLGVEMPIAQATYDVLFNHSPLDEVVSGLLGRSPRPE